jgi:hypothetical protein
MDIYYKIWLSIYCFQTLISYLLSHESFYVALNSQLISAEMYKVDWHKEFLSFVSGRLLFFTNCTI